ncbi:hypothetical protein KFZ76_16250 [Methylovulum psychrotolerans]|uniref:hypothetical protein n=1 Tax=Methylovulum psychrotolerans TaxID=1704499 RepID=UPI001BFF40CB|nr:hypothetical protein [Methylovulum psychrotolerans]MBT9099246.1 hypothetical protein [Methylovulum psychrotolerans]
MPLKKTYDYYIEPCQLCIQRNGATYENCGWCHDSDTHYSNRDGEYCGDYIILPYGGYGYPFHELPHPTRKYYKSNRYLENSDGKLPTDVSLTDIKEAKARNSATEKLRNTIKSGVYKFLKNPNSSNIEKIDSFAKKYKSFKYGDDLKFNQLNLEGTNLTGNIDHSTLDISFSGLNQDIPEQFECLLSKLNELQDKERIYDTEYLVEQYPEFRNMLKIWELFAHEYFHLIQILTLDVCQWLYLCDREITHLKAVIFYFAIQKNIKFQFGKTIFESLKKINEKSAEEFFNITSHKIDVINNFYGHSSKNMGLTTADIVESSAYVFQKTMNRSGSIDLFNAKNKPKYTKSTDFFLNKGGNVNVVFLLISWQSLKYGHLDTGEFMEDIPTAPEIFEYLCGYIGIFEQKIYEAKHSIPSLFNGVESLSVKEILDVTGKSKIKQKLTALGYESKEYMDSDLLAILNEMEEGKFKVFSMLLVITNEIDNKIQDFFKLRQVKFSRSKKINYAEIQDKKLFAIANEMENRFPFIQSVYFIPLLLCDFKFSSSIMHGGTGKILKNIRFDSFFQKNTTHVIDVAFVAMINSFEKFLVRQGKGTHCCAEHTEKVNVEDIWDCTNEDSLAAHFFNLTGKKLKEVMDV